MLGDGAAMKPAQPRRPRVALVLSRVDFSRPDYLAAREALELHGSAITVVSSRIGPATSDAKYEANQVAQVVQAEVAFGEIQPSDFDAIVFVPFSNSEFLYDPNASDATQKMTSRVLQELRESNVCLAAFGNAVFVLARYRILDGHAATGPEWIATKTEFATVKWDTSQPVMASGLNGQFVTAPNVRSVSALAEQVHAAAKKRASQ